MIQQKQLKPSVDSPIVDSPILLSPCQNKALLLLREAWLTACSTGQDIWQFAVEIDQLRNLGLTNTDLRLLLRWSYLAHAQERTTAESSQRIFQPLGTLMLPERTCFVLTDKGTDIKDLGMVTNETTELAAWKEVVSCPAVGEVPHWDRHIRQLCWYGLLIKQFRQSSDNQETILSALEEDGWPARMDDPLPRKPGIDPKIRLHDTIKALNRHQRHRLICFLGDGRGRGILWQRI